MDSELSSEAREIIAKARGCDDATPLDRDRVRAGWLAAVATGAGLSTLSETAGAAGGSLGVKATLAALVAVAAGAFALWPEVEETPEARGGSAPTMVEPSASVAASDRVALAPSSFSSDESSRDEPPPAPESIEPEPGSVGLVQAEPEPNAAGGSTLASAADEPPKPVRPRRAPQRRVVARATPVVATPVAATPADSLAVAPAQRPSVAASAAEAAEDSPGGGLGEEIAILSDARRALSRSDAAGALALLDAYERSFPEPTLRSEARALAVDALCASGRKAEARDAARAFLVAWPGSPLSERVKKSCP